MCGRYIIRITEKFLKEWEKLHPPPDFFKVSYNVAPAQSVPIIRWRNDSAEAAVVRWGLIPFFAKGEPPKFSTINARIETVETAASYRGPWNRGQRCLQLGSAFYEWHLDDSNRKAPYLISVANQETFAFAGLWDRSYKADGTAIESCVHITMPGNALLRDIHNTGSNPHRIPAILRREDWHAWLHGSADEARASLKQYPADSMSAYEVSTRVNSPKNDDEALLQPVQTGTNRE